VLADSYFRWQRLPLFDLADAPAMASVSFVYMT
jgi:hypothetical protein